jgi:hypothetical protein
MYYGNGMLIDGKSVAYQSGLCVKRLANSCEGNTT